MHARVLELAPGGATEPRIAPPLRPTPVRDFSARRSPGAGRRVAVLSEPGRSGRAALRYAARIAGWPGSPLAVIVIAAQARNTRGCLPSPDAFNAALREDAVARSREARRLLHEEGAEATEALLIEGREPTLRTWVLRHDVGLLLLPARRRPWGWGRHPAMSSLRALPGVDVRVVPGSGRRAPG